MKKILLFGGTGGIGQVLHHHLQNEFECTSVGSKTCDVTNEEEVKDYFSTNDFDVIIYLSVINFDGQIHRQNNKIVKRQLDVNVFGFLNVLRHCTEGLRRKKYGRIIYMSSTLANKPIRGTAIYSASKSFCESIMKTYSLENSRYGITANSIQLGYFDTGLTLKLSDDTLKETTDKIPLKRFGSILEISTLVKTIINTEYINGTNISITGGYENK